MSECTCGMHLMRSDAMLSSASASTSALRAHHPVMWFHANQEDAGWYMAAAVYVLLHCTCCTSTRPARGNITPNLGQMVRAVPAVRSQAIDTGGGDLGRHSPNLVRSAG